MALCGEGFGQARAHRPHPTITCTTTSNTARPGCKERKPAAARSALLWGGGSQDGGTETDRVPGRAVSDPPPHRCRRGRPERRAKVTGPPRRPHPPATPPRPSRDLPLPVEDKLLGPPLVTEQLSSERLGRPSALGVLGRTASPRRPTGPRDATSWCLCRLAPSPWWSHHLAILGPVLCHPLYLEVTSCTPSRGLLRGGGDNFGPRWPRSPRRPPPSTTA